MLPVAACSSTSDTKQFAAIDTTPISGITAATPVESGSAGFLQISPEAGHVLQVRERETGNGFHQDMVLAFAKEGHPENRIEIDVLTRPAQKGVGKPTEAGIRSEILSRFPSVPMKVVLQPRRNALGTFGLAIGARGDGARCIYAWQWVDDIRDAAGAGRSSLSRMMGHSTPASIRVSMCRRDATLDTLAMQVESLSLSNDIELEKVIAANSVAHAGTAAAAPNANGIVADLPASLESLVGAKALVQPSEKAKQRRKFRRATKPNITVQPKAPQQVSPPAIIGMVEGGPLYLAPVAVATPSIYAGGTPYVASRTTPTASAALDPTLPPQAYRGPSAGPGQ
ncbi:MAG: hypothetical protein NVSMB26_04170 [Beijerinckiaceae bacterium]